MQRMAPIEPAEMSGEQKSIADDIAAGPRGALGGPFHAWLRSPQLADKAQKLGAFCRFGTSLSPRRSELAILVTAAHWRANYEWFAHARIAREAGHDAAVIAALKARERPEFSDDGEALVHDYVRALIDRCRISDDLHERARAQLGEAGVVELVAIVGYYSLVAMTLNAFDVPLPEGVEAPFPD